MFILKKAIGPLLAPIPLCLIFLILGLLLLWFTKKQKAGKVLVSIGVSLLVILSLRPIPGGLIKSLEYEYPPLVSQEQIQAVNDQENNPVKWIVVLAGGGRYDASLPVTSQVSTATMTRTIEGIRLYRELPGTRLLLSGGRVFDSAPQAEIMAQLALTLGVKQEDVTMETVSKDTEDQAQLIKSIVSTDKFILVTSASHMPRSVALFKKQGMNPIPAPTDHQVRQNQSVTAADLYPDTRNLDRADRAFHEYFGMAWAKLTGKL